MKRCRLKILARTTNGQTPHRSLNERFDDFLNEMPGSERLDDESLIREAGSKSIADYLLSDRNVIAEVKILDTNPKHRVSKYLSNFFSNEGVVGFGTIGLQRMFNGLSNPDEAVKKYTSVSGRRVREALADADKQIASTRKIFHVSDAIGLAVILNQEAEHIDASNMAWNVRYALESHPERYKNINYIVCIVECHSIKIDDISFGYPVLLIDDSTSGRPLYELEYIACLIDSWTEYSNSSLHYIEHSGDWTALRPIWPNGTPAVTIR